MSELVSERAGTTLTLTLARPEKMNALSAALVEALITQVEAAYTDGTRLVVLRGEGRNFCAGFDFTDYAQQSEGDLLLRFARIEHLLQSTHHAPFDTLALAHGRNFGAGVDLFGACARRVAAPATSFRMPGLRFGLVLGTRRFARQVGDDCARDILQASKTFDAEEAINMGFIAGIADVAEWPNVVVQAVASSMALTDAAQSRLITATRVDTRDADLADLVRSAAAPGIKARIAAYLAER